uniref:Amelogenin X-linked n=1 Tax=Aquila chrysaetos chrysaetos TaxID=223781 RepID=A0A663EM61_AQUCH
MYHQGIHVNGKNTIKLVSFSICASILRLRFNGSWLHHEPTLPAVQQHPQMWNLPPLQHTLFMALWHQLTQIPRLYPVLSAAQHQPSLPMPAQTAQPQVGEQPNLPEQPQHPVNPSQPMRPQQLGNPHLRTSPMNPLPRLLLDMPLETRQSTD